MIYLDVTGGCLLPLQSGIPRTTRGLWRLLRDSGNRVRPICWQPFRSGYTRLSRRSRRLLEDPLGRMRPGDAPRDSTVPLLWSSFSDLRFWPELIPLPQLMKDGDTLLLTSLFPDNRLRYLKNLTAGLGRIVAIFHDAIPLRDANVSGWERRRHLEMLRLLARMDLVVAVSESARMDLEILWREHDILPAPTVAVPWPVPFTGRRPDFSPPSHHPARVLYVSRLKAVKNHETLFTACEILWQEGLDFELGLIGCEDEARESRAIKRRIKSLQREGHPLTWRAHVSEEDLHAAYQGATFTVFPSLMEGFGLPIAESLWHGRPVICSGHDAVGEIARGGGCPTADVRDPEALAAAMRELLQDENRSLIFADEAYACPVRTWADYEQDLIPLLGAR